RYLAGGVDVPAAQADVWRISDSASSRVQTVTFRTIPGLSPAYQRKVVSRIDLAGFGNHVATYTFRYNVDDGVWVQLTGCQNTDPLTQAVAVPLLTRIDLPDGTTYRMPASSYYPTTPGNVSPCKTGMLGKLGLPTLGSIAWDYIGYTYPTESTLRSFWQRTTGVGTRRLIDADDTTAIGTWTYSTAMSAPQTTGGPRRELINATTDPLGNRTVRYFSICAKNCPVANEAYDYGLPFTRQTAGDGTGRLLSTQIFAGTTLHRTGYVRYERDADPTLSGLTLEDKTRFNQRLASQRTAYQDGAATTVADQDLSDFDGFGHYRGSTTGGTFPGSDVRTAVTGYNPDKGTLGQPNFVPWPAASPWILGTYTFAWESEGGQLLYRSFCFNANTGFLRGRHVHAANGSNYQANDLVETYSDNGQGNVGTEKQYGGDAQALPTDPNGAWNLTCNNNTTFPPAYQTTHTYASGVRATSSIAVGTTTLKVLDQTIDDSTGLPSSSRDATSLATTYDYDPMGRPLTIAPPQSARTTYTYRNAATTASLAQVTVA